MANTYTLIASQTLGTTAASVTFSSIPSTYTDLVLKWSARSDANSGSGIDTISIKYNGVSGTSYSRTGLRGNGGGGVAASSSQTSSGYFQLGQAQDDSSATANTFSSGEIYIPSYTASQNKPVNAFYAQENNISTAYLWTQALLFSDTSVVSSILVQSGTLGNSNFVSGSSFYLYGIKNS